MKIIICHDKLPDRKSGWTRLWSELSELMTSRPEKRAWEFKDFEIDGSWSTAVKAASWVFRICSNQISLGLDWQRWVEILDTTRCTMWRCQHSIVSIGTYDLCLTPRVAKGWRQKEINPFVSETAVRLYYHYYYCYYHEYTTIPTTGWQGSKTILEQNMGTKRT